LILSSRGTGIAQADAPVIAARHQDERVETAGKRLRFATEAIVAAATSLMADKNARSIRTLVQPPAHRPQPAIRNHRAHTGKICFLPPVLFGNSLRFFVAEIDAVFATAARAAVTGPVLQDKQMADRPGHGESQGTCLMRRAGQTMIGLRIIAARMIS